jgi:hypothetical protein
MDPGGLAGRHRRLDRDLEPGGVQGAQLGDQGIGAPGLDGHQQDAGELPGEAGHVTGLPVCAGGGDRLGKPLDQPRAVSSDHGQRERYTHRDPPRDFGMVAIRRTACTVGPC